MQHNEETITMKQTMIAIALAALLGAPVAIAENCCGSPECCASGGGCCD